ncbi:MAG TPA: F0F1 ATP synthase subunit epsilon [Thermoflexia bacterium]|jgi:F-type H+-transporting ATPase subunit epsilon|nr:F0F1 ATP synthase subunit epsilon [Thermoflexia bacterium]
MGLQLSIVTPERELFTGEVDSVLAPGMDGEMGILPRHAPLIAALKEGVLIARQGEEEMVFAVHGGYMQVLPDRVIVLADVAERAEEIDIERAEAARRRAEELLKKEPPPEMRAEAIAALRRSLVRLRVARRRRYRIESERPESSD